jgi:DeoR family transcriptional regulator of aga operon
MARQIKRRKVKHLTVVTNGLNIALELASTPEVQVIVIGGMMRHVSLSAVGPHAERMLMGLNVDRVFLGVDALDIESGFSTPDVLEAQLNALMMRVSREITIVADASKFGRRSLSVIGKIEALHRVITDDQIDDGIVAALRARSVDVVIV